MSFSIEIDYRLDRTGFFDDPAVRAVMEAAAAYWEGIILDDFAEVPAGTSFDIVDPYDQSTLVPITLDKPIDDLLIFVGGGDLGGVLGGAAPGGRTFGGDGLGDVFERRVGERFRDNAPVSDFEPWAGWIVFDPEVDWSFDLAGPVEGFNDLYTTALHEIGHILGISTAGIYDKLSETGRFRGVNALELTRNVGIPVDLSGHVEDGYEDDTVLMDPFTVRGTRKLPTEFDLAMLADIGYEIAGYEKQGSQPAYATEGDDGTIYGTQLADFIDALGGDEQVQGGTGDDTLLGGSGDDSILGEDGDDVVSGGAGDDILDGSAGDDTVRGGPGSDLIFGSEGADAFAFAPGDGTGRIGDFQPGIDVLMISPAFGLDEAAAVLALATKPFANITRLTFADGTQVDVDHPAQDGTPLTADDIVFAELVEVPVIRGTLGADTLAGSAEDDRIEALAGDDVILGSAGSDTLDGGPGTDRARYDGLKADHRPTLGPDGTVTMAKPGGGTDSLSGVERIDLADGDYLYDLDGAEVAQIYRLYAAAFDRVPGESGLRFWFGQVEGGTTIRQAALRFVDNPEFDLRYGENPTDEEFILALYDNALKRVPAESGLAYWLDAFQSGRLDRADMLIAFSNSPENAARTAPDLDDGVWVIAPAFDDTLV